eukprot:m.438807 g.438807  ORF g.438807 m.438807 type:complete len:1246 (+) comp21446_c0_seq2:610-4347(+)
MAKHTTTADGNVVAELISDDINMDVDRDIDTAHIAKYHREVPPKNVNTTTSTDTRLDNSHNERCGSAPLPSFTTQDIHIQAKSRAETSKLCTPGDTPHQKSCTPSPTAGLAQHSGTCEAKNSTKRASTPNVLHPGEHSKDFIQEVKEFGCSHASLEPLLKPARRKVSTTKGASSEPPVASNLTAKQRRGAAQPPQHNSNLVHDSLVAVGSPNDNGGNVPVHLRGTPQPPPVDMDVDEEGDPNVSPQVTDMVIVVTTYAKTAKNRRMALQAPSDSIDPYTKRGITQCIVAHQIGPYDAATMEELSDLKKYPMCPIGDMFKVSFTMPKVKSQLGVHALESPDVSAPICFRMGSALVEVSNYYWHAETQTALCLRCRKPVSDADNYFRIHDAAIAQCLCEQPSDLLEPYSNAKSSDITTVMTHQKGDDPTMMETHMLLRVPRHRKDNSLSNEWCKELPLSTFDNKACKLKAMLIRVKVTDDNVDKPPEVFTGFVRLCGKNAGIECRRMLEAALFKRLKQNKPKSASPGGRPPRNQKAGKKRKTQGTPAGTTKMCRRQMLFERGQNARGSGRPPREAAPINPPNNAAPINPPNNDAPNHAAIGRALRRGQMSKAYALLRGAMGPMGDQPAYYSSFLEESWTMRHAPRGYPALCRLPVNDASAPPANTALNIPVDFRTLHYKVGLGCYANTDELLADTASFLTRVQHLFPPCCDEVVAATQLLRAIEPQAPGSKTSETKRRRRRGIKFTAAKLHGPTARIAHKFSKYGSFRSSWRAVFRQNEFRIAEHRGAADALLAATAAHEEHSRGDLGDAPAAASQGLATSVVACLPSQAYAISPQLEADFRFETVDHMGINDPQRFGERAAGQAFSKFGRRYYTAHHGETLASIAASHGIDVAVLAKQNAVIAALGLHAPLPNASTVLLLPTCTLTDVPAGADPLYDDTDDTEFDDDVVDDTEDASCTAEAAGSGPSTLSYTPGFDNFWTALPKLPTPNLQMSSQHANGVLFAPGPSVEAREDSVRRRHVVAICQGRSVPGSSLRWVGQSPASMALGRVPTEAVSAASLLESCKPTVGMESFIDGVLPEHFALGTVSSNDGPGHACGGTSGPPDFPSVDFRLNGPVLSACNDNITRTDAAVIAAAADALDRWGCACPSVSVVATRVCQVVSVVGQCNAVCVSHVRGGVVHSVFPAAVDGCPPKAHADDACSAMNMEPVVEHFIASHKATSAAAPAEPLWILFDSAFQPTSDCGQRA